MEPILKNYISETKKFITKGSEALYSIVKQGQSYYPDDKDKALDYALPHLRGAYCTIMTAAAFCDKLSKALKLPKDAITIELQYINLEMSLQTVGLLLHCASWSQAYNLWLKHRVSKYDMEEENIIDNMITIYIWTHEFVTDDYDDDERPMDFLKDIYHRALDVNNRKGL